MSEELDLFRVRAEYDVEVEKKSLNNASKLLDAFYKKYNDKSLKVDTADMATAVKQGVSEMQQIYKKGMDQLTAYQSSSSTQPPWWQAEVGLEDSLNREMSMMRDFFDDVKVLFSDKSLVSGLDNILSKSMENVSIVAVDLGERVNYLQAQITDTVDSLKQIGAVEVSEYGVIGYAGDSMSEEELKQRISLLEKVLEWQREIESFNNKKFSYENSPTSMESSSLNSSISEMKQNLFALKAFNLETTEQLRRRKQIIENATSVFDFVDQDDAIKNIEYNDLYNDNIDQLKSFIQKRKDAIQELKNNEDELFSIDGISDYIETANKQIKGFQSQINELHTLKYGEPDDTNDMPVVGNLSDVVDALGRVEQAVRDVVDAFKPLTDALSNEDSAVGAMVTATVSDLEVLNQKVEEAFKNIETLSNKQFNMTNVISNSNGKNNDLEQIRAFRIEARDTYKQVEELYMESMETSKKIKGTPEGISAFLDFSNTMADFDMSDLAKRIKSRSAASLGIVIDELNEWKKVLLQFNNLRNNVDAGSFNVSKYSDTSSKVSIGSKTTDKDEKPISGTTKVDDNDILNQVKNLSEKAQEELTSIRAKIEETFNFATLNPQLDNVQTIADNIYNIFTDLQEKINALRFKLQLPEIVDNNKAESDLIDGASDAMQDEGDAAQDAVPKKNAFTEANKKAADSAKATEDATKSAAEGVEAEGKAIEQSAGAIVEANDKFDKIKYINDIDENGIPKPRSKVTIGTDKKENAYETTSTFLEYDEESGKYIQKAETVVKDFKKRATELKKEAAKIELAKKTVAKFLSQFDNKTAGHGKDIAGYDTLKNFKINNLDDIENAMQQMIALDTRYNELTRDFRKGTKSMNPFVNAFNSMDEMRNKVKSIQIDFDNLKSPTDTLREQVEGLPELLENLNNALKPDENGAINIENIAKAYGNLNEAIKQVNSSISVQNKEQKTRNSQEDDMWAAYTAEQNAASEKERQIELAYSQKAAEEAAEAEKILAQSRKEADEFFAAEDAKELNTLYKDRSSVITRIIQLNKKLGTLKTDKAKERTRQELENEKERLALIDQEINQYGRLIDRQKLQKQNYRLSNANIDIDVSKQQKQDVEEVNKALQRRKEIHEEIIKLQKQLDAAEGYQEQSVIKKEITALKARELAYTKLLASYKDNALQRMVTEQDNSFRNKDEQNKRQKRIKDAEDVDNAAVASQKEDYEEVLSLVKQLHDAQTALHKINVDPSNKAHTAEREKEIARVKELSKLLKEVYGIDIKNLSESLNKSSLLTQEQKNKLLQQEREYRQDILDLTAKAVDKATTKENKEAQNYGKTIYNREKRNRDVIGGNISSLSDIDLSDDFLAQIKEYEIAYKRLEALRSIFEKSPNAQKDGGLRAQFNESAVEVEKLRKALMSAFKEYQKFANIPDDSLIDEDIIDVSKFNDAKSAMIDFANRVTDGKFQFEGFNAAGTEMYGVIDKGNGVLEQVTVSFSNLTGEMKAFTSGTKQVTTSWSKLGTELKQGINQIVSQYIGFHELWQAIKSGVGYVREIDLALTELRKVTSETDLTYKNFLKTMSQTGSAVGATVADLTSSAADWARLGYSIEEAGALAKNTAILMNVSEFDDVTEATDTLISALQAFKNEETDVATYSMQIIDEMNEVGNAYAISTSDLANSLTRSSAALAAANNSLEESIAMTTAANTIIQDPEAVGNALKVVSMRIRGVKTELEEAGEDTEGMVTNTAKLQEKIMALTNIDGTGGVNILADDGSFKSTYQILLEISKVWDKIDDTAQAGLLEVLAGKVRGSTVAALLSGGDIMEAAYNSASNASGSAQEELDKYLDSIDGKITQFNNSLQTMWMNLLDSEVIKNVVDFGTTMVKFLDTVPGKITAILAALAGFSKLKGISIFGLGKEAGASLQNYQQALLKLGSIKLSGVEYDSTQMAAYAQAVDGLTAKKQAEMLATMGLNKVQIIEIMNRNNIGGAVIEETLNKMNLANTTKKLTTTTVEAALATQLSKDAMKDQAVAEFLAANGSKTLTAELLAQMVQQKILTAEQAAAILTTNKLAFSWKVLGQSIAMAFKANPIGFIISIASTILTVVIPAIQHFHKSAAELKEEVNDLAGTYEDAKKTFESNLVTLTTSSDTKQFATLQDEFNLLAQGVDRYGNNISLTTDQYERYKAICQQIVGIQPSIAAGYDSATQAIGNNVNILEDLIELQRIQARQNAENRVSDENLGKFAEDALNDYNEALRNFNVAKSTAFSDLNAILYQSFKSTKQIDAETLGSFDFSGNGTEDDDLMEYVLSTLGVENIPQVIQSYFRAGQYDVTGFLNDYYDQIKENSLNFGIDYQSALNDTFTDIAKTIRSGGNDIKKANDALVDDFLIVPQSEESYDKLGDASKNFITDWIKNSPQFKVDANQTEEIAIENRDKIIDMINMMAGKDFLAEIDGQTISGQDLLDQIYNFDLTSVNWQEYKVKAESFVKAMWDAIGGAENDFGMTQIDLMNMFGFNFTEIESGWQTIAKQIDEHTDMAFEDVREMLGNEMNAKQVDAFFKINWNDVDWDNVNSKQDILDIINKKAQEIGDITPVKTYSVLVSEIESYNDILSQTSEIVSDNTEVTQEYKDSLIALGVSEEELAECFDENNGLIVKNAAALRRLVAQKKQDKQATVQQAKSMSQLQYKNTVQQLQQVVKAMAVEVRASGLVSSAALKTSESLREQLTVLKQTIQQYALLEISLSDAANAYSEFEAAKERDAQLTYGDSMIEMLQTINEGFKTGQVGTEAFQYAVKVIVPESEYAHIDNIEQRMIAIHDYIDKNPLFADWFTIDEGEFSIAIDNINSFIDDAYAAGLFTSDSSGDFFLTEAIKNAQDPLKEFADQLGRAFNTEVTEGSVLAMLTELEKYDASWGNILTDLTTTPLDRAINDATIALEEAITAQEEFITSGGDLNSDEYRELEEAVSAARGALDASSQAAIDNAQAYTQIQAVLKGMTGEVKYTQEQADALARSLGLINENSHIQIDTETGALILTKEQVDALNERLTGLTEPTILDVQLAYDEIDRQLQELNAYLSDPSNYSGTILTELNITNEGEAKAKVDELTADRDAIELVYNITTTSTDESGTFEKLTTWEANGVQITISGDASEFEAAVNATNAVEMDGKTVPIDADPTEANASMDTVDNREMEDKKPGIYMQGVSVALNDIHSIGNALDTLPFIKDIYVNVHYRESGAVGVNGTAHVNGTAYSGGNWGAPRTEVALTGELGPEMVVRDGRWFTVGENGAEFTQIKKGDIIFNHKQTEDLLSKGYVTSRGKAYASGTIPNTTSGTAYYKTFGGYVGDDDVFENGSDNWMDPWSNSFSDAAGSLSDAADSMSDAADDTEQMVDFIEIKLEKIEAIIEKTTARIENFLDDTTSINSKDELYDELVKAEKEKAEVYLKAAQKYDVEAAEALSGVPQQYQEMARNGAIAIKDFIGEDQTEIAEKIEKYRDLASKADEAENGHLEAIAAISAHRVEQLEDIATDFENIISISQSHSDLLQAEMDFIEESGNRLSESYYEELKKHSQKQLDDMQNERVALQKILDDAVAAGDVIIGSDDWYSMLETIYEVDQGIVDCKTSLEEFQNAINDLYWDNFDKLITEIDNVNSELSNLYDLISDDDNIVDDMGNWTADGYTALGLLIQQMEVAQQKSKEYGDAISKLKQDYRDGLYSTDEYNEKLAELTDGQYAAIKSYEDAKDAIVDLNKTRVNAIKNGIEKEIDAYEELINKKKESLDADKDARDFERSVEESNKSISDVERKIASLKGNTSSSAIAERRRLEEELRKLQQEREDLFYNESVENQQEALDKELKNFQDAKNKEIEDLEEYLKNQEKVLQDSFAIVQENTQQIAGKLIEITEDYGVTISDTVATPWIKGTNAIGTYEEQLNTSVSATTKNLETLKQQLEDLEAQADKTANSVINATHSSIVETNDGYQTSIKGYAKGSKSVEYDQWALIEELGDELQLVPNKSGRLAYIKKGTGILNNTLTERLMDLAIDPTSMLENSRPVVGAPGITTTNNTFTIDASIGTLLHVEHLDGSNPAEVTKLVDKAWEKKMQTLNNSIKKFTR